MASYASMVDNGRISCFSRNRRSALVLYAALKRGRDYLSETSGATELFDEIKAAIRDQKRNPIFDSVLEDSQEFAPELECLTGRLRLTVAMFGERGGPSSIKMIAGPVSRLFRQAEGQTFTCRNWRDQS